MAAWIIVGAVAHAVAEPAPSPMVTCVSTGERVECPAETSRGVTLRQATGDAECTFGSSWGYDAGAVWVSDGCAGEFVLGASAAPVSTTPQTSTQASTETNATSTGAEPRQVWGVSTPGKGFLVGKTEIGELSISAYALLRYLNQLPSGQTFVDHLGRTQEVDARHDIWAHRILMSLNGWVGLPDLQYQIIFWTVNATDQDALFAILRYRFHRTFSLSAGIGGLPGSRTLQGSHPFWLGHDRVMADEFFRPYFTHGVWAVGEVLPGLWYHAMVGNNLSNLDITAAQLTRDFAYGATVWWMPTTGEFGPSGSFDDWEWHEEVATRFGVAATYSRENRFTRSSVPDNTTLKLADSLNLFDTGALAPDVTVGEARYRLLSADAGLKYRGIFLQAHYFHRWLDDFVADGPIPSTSIVDKGFYVQAAFYLVKQKLELYGATSWVLGDESEGFSTHHEYLGGANWFLAPTRNIRVNAQLIRVNRSPTGSSFGYYIGGQKGFIASLATSILF